MKPKIIRILDVLSGREIPDPTSLDIFLCIPKLANITVAHNCISMECFCCSCIHRAVNQEESSNSFIVTFSD